MASKNKNYELVRYRSQHKIFPCYNQLEDKNDLSMFEIEGNKQFDVLEMRNDFDCFENKLYIRPSTLDILLLDGIIMRIEHHITRRLDMRPSVKKTTFGYEGFNFNFIRKMWDTIGEDIGVRLRSSIL